jgi:flagellin
VQQTTPSYGTTTANITFSVTGSGTSQAITSSAITTGATLGGSLTINSTGVLFDAGSATLNLANYQGLSSSNAATATAAANKLAWDLTNDLWGTTSLYYSASISGGVLTIKSTNPGDSQSIDMSGAGNSLTSAVSLVTGDTLGGTTNFTSHGHGVTLDFSSYQGLTSSNAATVSATLTQLGQDITGGLNDGYTYTAYINSSGKLVINSSNPNDNLVDKATETETPSGDPAGELLSVGSGHAQQTYSLAPVVTPTSVNLNGTTTANLQSALQSALGSNYSVSYNTGSGALNITVSAAGLAAGVTSIATTSNSAQETSGGTAPVTTPTSVDITGQTGTTLGSYLSSQLGQDYSVAYNQTTGALSISISSHGANTDGIGSIAAGTGSAQETTAGSPQRITPKTVSLTGVATTNLESYLQAQLGGDYSVSYDQVSGDLSILLNSDNADGVTSFTSSSTVQQNVGSSPAVSTSSTVNLTGVAPANLQTTLQNALGSNYTVSYDTTSGTLNIGISSAGDSAGVRAIAANTSGVEETAPSGGSGLSAFNVFTSDGTVNGSTSLDVTVGSLTTANLGTSNGDAGQDMTGSNLSSQASAASALNLITAAANSVASQRGAVGASINRLTATVSDESTEQINLTSATNAIQSADIGKTVANMTQYNILLSTGMAALQQANQAQQAVLKLVQ